MISKTFQLSGMHCASCSMLIEGALEDKGVMVKAHYTKQIVEVTFDPGTIQEDAVVRVIEELGYQVTAKRS